MRLALREIIPPPEWRHDPILLDEIGYTVAMNLAQSGIIPPKEWYHDPILCNDYG